MWRDTVCLFMGAESRKVNVENTNMMFSSVPVSDHIKSALAAPYAALARWSKALAPVLFALGTLLLVPAAPHWTGWVQALTSYKLPTEDMVGGWLANLLSDPVTVLSSQFSEMVQAWLYTAGQIDVLVTLATIVLAMGSVAGLVQLLGDEQKIASPGAE